MLSCANWRKLSTPAEADKIGRFSRYQCIGKTQISADISARLIYRSISRCKYSALMLINCWTLAQQVSNFLTLRVVWYREQHFSADVVYYYCETTTTLCLVPCRIAAYAASSNLKQAIEGWFKQNVTHGIVAQELVSYHGKPPTLCCTLSESVVFNLSPAVAHFATQCNLTTPSKNF